MRLVMQIVEFAETSRGGRGAWVGGTATEVQEAGVDDMFM